MQSSVSVAVDHEIVWSRHNGDSDCPTGVSIANRTILERALSLLVEATAQVKAELGGDDSKAVADIARCTTQVNDGVPNPGIWHCDATRETAEKPTVIPVHPSRLECAEVDRIEQQEVALRVAVQEN
jgi:hypothetical protein